MSRNRISLLISTTAAAIAGALCTYMLTLAASNPPEVADLRLTVPPAPKLAIRPTSVHPTSPRPADRQTVSAHPAPEATKPAPPDIATWSIDVQRNQTPPAVSKPRNATRNTAVPKKRTRPARRRKPRYTLKSRLAGIEPKAKPRLAAKFAAAKVAWPPTEVAFVAIKDERILELHARSMGTAWKLVHRYPVKAASGGAGPKLKRGDKQVPEGIYRITYLNPNSAFHVSLRVSYPNRFDRRMARKDGRRDLGGDIMIHGKKSSAGCLAMGDDAAEELFVLAAMVGKPKIKLIIAPTDFRKESATAVSAGQPQWLPALYSEIATAMAPFPKPPKQEFWSFFTQ